MMLYITLLSLSLFLNFCWSSPFLISDDYEPPPPPRHPLRIKYATYYLTHVLSVIRRLTPLLVSRSAPQSGGCFSCCPPTPPPPSPPSSPTLATPPNKHNFKFQFVFSLGVENLTKITSAVPFELLHK